MLAQAVLQGAEPASHPTKSAAAFARRTVIVDPGPLEAAIDRSDDDHTWAVHALRSIPARCITCEAAITEAQHGLENHWAAVQALRRLLGRMEVVSMASARLGAVCDQVEQWAPRMDFADACAVVLVQSRAGSFVLTTDFRDFSNYRVPFVSPEGAFHA